MGIIFIKGFPMGSAKKDRSRLFNFQFFSQEVLYISRRLSHIRNIVIVSQRVENRPVSAPIKGTHQRGPFLVCCSQFRQLTQVMVNSSV